MRGWVNGQIAITVARLYSHIIRGDFLPSTLKDRDPDWGSGLGLGLAK